MPPGVAMPPSSAERGAVTRERQQDRCGANPNGGGVARGRRGTGEFRDATACSGFMAAVLAMASLLWGLQHGERTK